MPISSLPRVNRMTSSSRCNTRHLTCQPVGLVWRHVPDMMSEVVAPLVKGWLGLEERWHRFPWIRYLPGPAPTGTKVTKMFFRHFACDKVDCANDRIDEELKCHWDLQCVLWTTFLRKVTYTTQIITDLVQKDHIVYKHRHRATSQSWIGNEIL